MEAKLKARAAMHVLHVRNNSRKLCSVKQLLIPIKSSDKSWSSEIQSA